MTVSVAFYTNDQLIPHTAGSGLGFYGPSAGDTVPVSEWQSRTFICSSAGVNNGVEGNNIKWHNAGSGIIGQAGSGVGLKNIPNYLATLEIRLASDTEVQVQSASFLAYDRVSASNPPSGLTLKAAEAISISASQLVVGSGDDSWTTLAGTGSTLTLANSPGASGHYAGNGTNSTWSDMNHAWFVHLSAQPSSVDSKTFAGLFQCEYL